MDEENKIVESISRKKKTFPGTLSKNFTYYWSEICNVGDLGCYKAMGNEDGNDSWVQ